MRTLRLELPSLPPVEYSANRSRGVAWQRQYRVSHGNRGAVDEIVALVREQGWQGPPMQRAEVAVTFYLPNRRRLDGLALWERMKVWIDGLVQGENPVLKDADLTTIGFPTATWEYRKGRPGTLIEVREPMGEITTNLDRGIPPKTRVAYCSSCPVYVEEAEIGHLCPFGDCNRKLRLRVGYICQRCEEQPIFFTPASFLNHTCEGCEDFED